MDERIREVERRYEELSSLLADPATIADPKRLREYSREHAKLSETVRAVGRANGQTPIAIIVPCHRVIGADGAHTGYGGGLARKQALLNLEQRTGGGL